MELHESLDAANVIAARLKPFLGLPAVIQAAIEAQDAVKAAEARKATLQAENDGLELDRARLADELKREREAAGAERKERQSELVRISDQVHEARNQAQNDMLAAEVKVRGAQAELEAEYAARKVALQAEIAGLEATRDELQKQVDATKEKFRALVG